MSKTEKGLGEIRFMRPLFKKYGKKEKLDLPRTYTSKPLILFGDTYTFVELAVLAMFKKDGWNGVWADSFHRKLWADFPGKADPVGLPDKIKVKLMNLFDHKNIFKIGAWDLILWKGKKLLFVECKGIPSHDKIRDSQVSFMKRALDNGFTIDNFVVVEWNYRN